MRVGCRRGIMIVIIIIVVARHLAVLRHVPATALVR